MPVHVRDSHLRTAARLVARARANGGLAPLDLERFWADDERARRDPWAADCPQVPLGIGMSNECVFAELGVPEDWYRLLHDAGYRVGLERAYNDRAQQVVGRRLLGERMPEPARAWPRVRELHDIFEAENVWQGNSYWLMESAHGEDELAALLDRVEARLADLRAFLLPPDWDAEKARLRAAGAKPPLYRGQRGPITFAMSIYGVERLIFLIEDHPELAARFRDTILRAILARARVLDEEAGFTPATAPRGWSWADDNCAMLTPAMYEFFGCPILRGVFERYSPDPGDWRYQHSDSDMAHLLPLLARFELKQVNFGPTLTVAQIREHMPRTVIQGQLAPFTFSRNEEENLVAEFLRDFEMARERRGLLFATAGSVNNGSRLSGMRLVMAAIQEHGRYA